MDFTFSSHICKTAQCNKLIEEDIDPNKDELFLLLIDLHGVEV